jgi:hypothetical protein
VNRRVSTQTSLTIDKAIQLDPNGRFPSALAMKVALQGKKRSRWPLMAAAIGVPLMLVVAGLAFGGWWFFLRDGSGGEEEATLTAPVVAVVETDTPTPSATPTQAPTSTSLPTLTPTATSLPTDTPSPTPTLTPTATSTPILTARPTLEVTLPPTSGPVFGTGTIFYTIQADVGYYLAQTNPTMSKGELIGLATYAQSTCSSEGVAKTLEGDTFNLYYGYRCGLSKIVECASPDGQYEVVLFKQEKNYMMSIRRASDEVIVAATYNGPLDSGIPIMWSPDSRYFYFGINKELHRASPYEAGYQAVAAEVNQPWLSPDGSMVLYLKPVGAAGVYDVMVVNATGPRSEPVNVTNAPDIQKLCPRWGR